MTLIRKFFDSGQSDVGGVVDSSFFAGGTKDDFTAPGAPPSDPPAPTDPPAPKDGEPPTPGAKDQPPADDPKADPPKDPKASDIPADPPKVDPPAPDPPKKEEPKPAAAPEPVNWKEVLKKTDRTEVLKELGLDQFEIDLLEYRKQTGDLTPYLEAKSKDWDKVSDEAIMRSDLRTQYADLSDEEFQLIEKEEIDDRFKLGEDFTEAEKKVGAVKLKVEAGKIRKALKEQQAKFAIPKREPEPDKPAENAGLSEDQLREWGEKVKSNPVTQKLLTDKRIVLGSGDKSYNFEVKPEDIIEATVDQKKFYQSFFDEQGNMDYNKWYATVAFSQNRENYEKALIDHGFTLGSDSVLNKIQNPTKKDEVPGGAPSEPASEAQALIRGGTIGTMNW